MNIHFSWRTFIPEIALIDMRVDKSPILAATQLSIVSSEGSQLGDQRKTRL